MTAPHLLTAPGAAPPRLSPADALEALAGQLPDGTRSYVCADRLLGVLSLPTISVWSNGRLLWWRAGVARLPGQPLTRPGPRSD